MSVEFDAQLKRVTSALKTGEGGPEQVTSIALEGTTLTGESVRRLLALQGKGVLRITIEARQTELPLEKEKKAA